MHFSKPILSLANPKKTSKRHPVGYWTSAIFPRTRDAKSQWV